MLLLDKPSQKAPFTLLFSEKIDPSLYTEAIKDSQKLADTYNPETQTSDFSIYAGTSLTYEESYSGWMTNKDDNNQTDT
jgi:hypothetical protein